MTGSLAVWGRRNAGTKGSVGASRTNRSRHILLSELLKTRPTIAVRAVEAAAQVDRAQHRFQTQYGHFATSLAELVHSGSFTKRMVDPHRGDYTAAFKGKKDSFILTMTPNHLDAEHRSFYAEDDGKIHGDEEEPADASSPIVK